MQLTTYKWIKWRLIPGLFILYGILQIAINLAANPSFTLLEYPGYQSNFTLWQESKLLQGQTVAANFTASAQNLGIVAVRFFNFGQINDDVLIFRIKEAGQTDWFYQNKYKVDQFLPNQLFTFGFPPIKESEGKRYQFELESIEGTPNNAVALSTQGPVFVAKHEFSKQAFMEDKSLIIYFLWKKIQSVINISLISKLFSAAQPLILYLLFLSFFGPKLERLVMKLGFIQFLRKKIAKLKLSEKIDNFFLLDRRQKFSELDGLRAWAATMVITTHLIAGIGTISNLAHADNFTISLYYFYYYFPFIGLTGGTVGVDLFFLISGFLMFVTLLRKKDITFKNFIFQRYARLLPAHIAVLLPHAGLTLVALLLNIFFLVDLFPWHPNANSVTWSLTYEIIFYLICAFWFILGRKNKLMQSWKFFFFLTITIYSTQIIKPWLLENTGIRYTDMTRFMAFFFGVALGKLYSAPNNLWPKIQDIFVRGAIPGLILINLAKYYWSSFILDKKFGQLGINFIFIMLDIGLFLVVGSVLSTKPNFLKRIFSHKFLRVIGVISYSMYLNHVYLAQPVGNEMIKSYTGANVPIKMTLFMLVTYLASFLMAIFLFHYLEKPYFMRKKVELKKTK